MMHGYLPMNNWELTGKNGGYWWNLPWIFLMDSDVHVLTPIDPVIPKFPDFTVEGWFIEKNLAARWKMSGVGTWMVGEPGSWSE